MPGSGAACRLPGSASCDALQRDRHRLHAPLHRPGSRRRAIDGGAACGAGRRRHLLRHGGLVLLDERGPRPQRAAAGPGARELVRRSLASLRGHQGRPHAAGRPMGARWSGQAPGRGVRAQLPRPRRQRHRSLPAPRRRSAGAAGDERARAGGAEARRAGQGDRAVQRHRRPDRRGAAHRRHRRRAERAERVARRRRPGRRGGTLHPQPDQVPGLPPARRAQVGATDGGRCRARRGGRPARRDAVRGGAGVGVESRSPGDPAAGGDAGQHRAIRRPRAADPVDRCRSRGARRAVPARPSLARSTAPRAAHQRFGRMRRS